VVTPGILIPQSEVTGHFYRFEVLVPKMEILIPQSAVTGMVFMFLLAATFLVFAILSKKNWWAIIRLAFLPALDWWLGWIPDPA